MKCLSFSILAFFFSFQAWAEPVAGTLEKLNTTTFLTLNSTGEKYLISSIKNEAEEGLSKLESGDFIIGNGTIDVASHTLQLDSLDYVGLKKLLGIWYSGENVMNFSSFSNLSVYSLFNLGKGAAAVNLSAKMDFRYSTAPLVSGKQKWAVFLSSKNSTVFATIEFSSNSSVGPAIAPLAEYATLRTYNVETGSADRTIRLIRWSK